MESVEGCQAAGRSGSVLIWAFVLVLIGVTAVHGMRPQNKVRGRNRDSAFKRQSSVLHDHIIRKRGLVMAITRFVGVIDTSNKGHADRIGHPCSRWQLAPVSIQFCNRDIHVDRLGVVMPWEQYISERSHPISGGSIIARPSLDFTQIITQKSWRQFWVDRNILGWRSPNVRRNESEPHCHGFAIKREGRCNTDVEVNPRPVSVSHYLKLILHSAELFSSRNIAGPSLVSSLLRSCIQEIGLDGHFFELPIENRDCNNAYQESYDGDEKRSLGIAERVFLKLSKFSVFNYTYGKRFVNNPYALWSVVCCLIIVAWIVGSCGCDIWIEYGRWGQTISTWFEMCSGRPFTDGERVAIGVSSVLVCTALLFQAFIIVAQKYLDPRLFSYYTNYMPNVLGTDKQIGIIGALCEGSSIRSIERTTGVHRDTIMRLGVKVGKGCAALMDAKMRNLDCHRLEMDEIWGYVGKKQKALRPGDDPQLGNVWTFCAIDADTKLVPTFHVSNDRGVQAATDFALDVADRMKNRVQISTDGLAAYVEAIDWAFGCNVDYGQIIKVYGTEESVEAQRRYSAPKITASEKKAVFGRPYFDLISTSYVERLNATTRLHVKRLARLTHAFSKKRENFEAAVGLHFAYYNFVRRHNTLRCTPAMAASVEQSFWSVGDLLEATA